MISMLPENRKLIHVVGGGFNQIPLVQKARSLGLHVLVTDMCADAPARQYADYFEPIDTASKEPTLRCAEQYGIDFVITDQTDVAVPTVAYVAEKLDLPGIGYQTALKFTNKYIMRRALEAEFKPYLPEVHFFDDPKEAAEFCHVLERPGDYVIKPINAQGSKGVAILTNGFEQLISNAFDESRERGILIEKFIRGFEFSVETFVKDHQVYNLTITKKYHYRGNPCLDERNTFLGDVDPGMEQDLFELNSRIIKALNLPFGSTHAEYKIQEGRIYLIEIAARGAGGSINSLIIPYLTEFDPLDAHLKLLTGRRLTVNIQNYKNRFAVLKFFNFPPGLVRRIWINPQATSDLLVFSLEVKEGDTIRPIRDSRDRPGYFVAHGTDRNEVLAKERLAEDGVQVEYAQSVEITA